MNSSVCTFRDIGSTFVLGMLLGAVLEFWIDVFWRIAKDKRRKFFI